MNAGCQWRPVLLQFARQHGELWPRLLGDAEIGGGKRVLFDRDEMQAVASRGVGTPGLPGGKEVEPEAEAGLEYDETLPLPPTRRKIVAAKKDMPGLSRAAVGRMVDVAIAG